MRNIKKISLTLFLTFITACSGGGGGGSSTSPSTGGGGSPVLGCMDPLANNYDSSATQDDGSCSYGGGGGGGGQANASYYGYNLSTLAAVENRAAASLDASASTVANIFTVDTNSTKVQTNNVDVLVYQPSCQDPANLDPSREYRFIMVAGGSSVNSTMIKMKLDSNGDVRITPIEDVSTNIWSFVFNLTAPNDQTWTCLQGKYTLSGGAVLYSNNSVAVLKLGSSIYLGFTGSTLADNTAIGLSNVVWFQKSGGYNWSTGGTFGSDSGEVYTTAQGYSNGGPSNNLTEIDFGTYYSFKAVKNDNGANGFVAASQNGSRMYYGVLGSIGGKKVGVFSGSHDPNYPSGSDSYSILIEQ